MRHRRRAEQTEAGHHADNRGNIRHQAAIDFTVMVTVQALSLIQHAPGIASGGEIASSLTMMTCSLYSRNDGAGKIGCESSSCRSRRRALRDYGEAPPVTDDRP